MPKWDKDGNRIDPTDTQLCIYCGEHSMEFVDYNRNGDEIYQCKICLIENVF